MKAEIRYDNPKKTINAGYYVIMGGMSSNPTWEEYIREISDEFKPHFEAIRKAIEYADLEGKCADEIANNVHFRCEDGIEFGFSWRAWGDLMQAIVGKQEGYMEYYMNLGR